MGDRRSERTAERPVTHPRENRVWVTHEPKSHTIKVTLSDRELERLDELRGSTARAAHLRRLVYEPPDEAEIATRGEALGLLSRAARSGSVTAAVALLRALKDEDEPTIDDALERILGDE